MVKNLIEVEAEEKEDEDQANNKSSNAMHQTHKALDDVKNELLRKN